MIVILKIIKMKEVEGQRNKIFIRILGSVLHVFAADVVVFVFLWPA